jgi:MFS family permease
LTTILARLRENAGALAERNFRLVFLSTTVSALGDGVASIALVFAVLELSNDSATAVAVVLASRQVGAAVITLAAGVISDRLPRHIVLVAVAVVQAVTQAAAATAILSGTATVTLLAALAAVYGLADGFVLPATQGLIPAITGAAHLQQANALRGLSNSILSFAGPILGGILVTAGSPGAAIAIDAVSFAVAAALLVRLTIAPREDVVTPEPFFAELREGWAEFRRQTWIWSTVLLYGISNFVGTWSYVLVPLVMKQHYNGAVSYGVLLGAFGLGTILGGVVALRWRPSRPLLVSCEIGIGIPVGYVLIAVHAPLAVLLGVQVLAGIGLAVHWALWSTVFQQHVPEHARARVSSYDALGSFVLVPLGTALAGPVSNLVGIESALLIAAGVYFVTKAIMFCLPSVWAIRREPAPA